MSEEIKDEHITAAIAYFKALINQGMGRQCSLRNVKKYFRVDRVTLDAAIRRREKIKKGK